MLEKIEYNSAKQCFAISLSHSSLAHVQVLQN